MRIHRSATSHGLRRVVRLRSRTYTVERPTTEATARFGSEEDTATNTFEVEMFVYDPTETNIETEYGERIRGDMEALALSDVDIRDGDQVRVDGITYDVDRVQAVPNDTDPSVLEITLQRRTNDG